MRESKTSVRVRCHFCYEAAPTLARPFPVTDQPHRLFVCNQRGRWRCRLRATRCQNVTCVITGGASQHSVCVLTACFRPHCADTAQQTWLPVPYLTTRLPDPLFIWLEIKRVAFCLTLVAFLGPTLSPAIMIRVAVPIQYLYNFT